MGRRESVEGNADEEIGLPWERERVRGKRGEQGIKDALRAAILNAGETPAVPVKSTRVPEQLMVSERKQQSEISSQQSTVINPPSDGLEQSSVEALSVSERNQQSAISNPQSGANPQLALALPFVFLTVTLLGGLRVIAEDQAFVFVPPPLITLVLAVLLMLLFVRGGLIDLRSWLGADRAPLDNMTHLWILLTLFFASAQAFNSVLPERGLLHWLFSFFFLWTLWNNQFSTFDAPRLLRSLAVLFGTAFVLKHMLLASLYSADGGWLKRMTGAFVSGVTLGTFDAPAFAPATGYISFFTLGLYIVGLVLVGFATGNSVGKKGSRGRGNGELGTSKSADYADYTDSASESESGNGK